MNSKTFLPKTASVLAALALAFAGNLVAVQPAAAAFDPLTNLTFQSVTRGDAQISGSSVTDSVAIQTGERSTSYNMRLEYASVGSPYTLTTALTGSNKPVMAFGATSGGTVVPTSVTNPNWFIEYSTGNGFQQWSGGQDLPAGTYTVFRIFTSGSFTSTQQGPKTLDLTMSISINGTVATPLGFNSSNPTGLFVSTPSSTLAYVPVANDKQVLAMFRACIWVEDQSGLVTGDTVQVTAANTVTNPNSVSMIFTTVSSGASQVSSGGSDTSKSFTVPASSTIIEAQIQVNVNQITIGQEISLTASAQKNGTGANMLDSCNKVSPASSASPTVTGNGTTTTVTWTAPTDLVSAGYSSVRVIACTTTLQNCAAFSSLTSQSGSGLSSTNSSALNLNATTFTASTSSMSGSWSASTSYKYAVVYYKTPSFQPSRLDIRAGIVWIGGPTSAISAAGGVPSPSPSPSSSAEVSRVIPTPAFLAPILNSLAPKLTSGFSSNGGRLVMKDVKPADIASVMLNGKKVEVVASKSGAALRIPAGAGAGDLKFTMADGTVIDVPNAVKITTSQVDPKLVDLNNLPTFKAGSVAVPSTIKKALLKNKSIILDSVSAKCVGYASSNTASARATALARASNVCGVITDINENIEPIVKVLVNKAVSSKSPVKYQTW